MKLTPQWVVGFVDGEGCFHVSINRHPAMSIGYQVLPEFVVVQQERDMQILLALQEFFQAGAVRRNHGDRYCLRIRKIADLFRVCAFFEAHPLQTRKHTDFRKFQKVLNLIEARHHLRRRGLLEIVDIVLSMNTCNRPALEKCRLDLLSDKEIVHASMKVLETS